MRWPPYLCRTTEEINRAFDELQASLGVKRDAKMEETRQLVLENLNPTTQEKLQVIKRRVEDYLERRKQIFWDLSVIMLEKNHPDMFINPARQVFGPFEEQVFDRPSDIVFNKNFNFCLDFSSRDNNRFLSPQDRKAVWRGATPYNPDSEFGRIILREALAQPVEACHLLLKAGDKLKSGQRGRLILSLFRQNAPEKSFRLLSAVVDDHGEALNLKPEDIFDNVRKTAAPVEMGYQDLIRRLHERNIAEYEKSEKHRVDVLLKIEVDKLTRWLADEKQAIHLKGEKMKNKIGNLKRQFKLEKDFAKKLALDEEIKRLQKEMNDNEFNTFDIERELEKKCNRLIGGKKRSLKLDYTIEQVFDVTWEVKS